MNRPFGTYALISLALVVIGVLENVFFGADSGGLKHHVSVGFFFLTLLGFLGVIVFGVLAGVILLRRRGTA